MCWGSNEQGALGHKSSKHWLTYVGDQENEEFLTVPFELSIDGTLPLAVQVACCSVIWNGVNLLCRNYNCMNTSPPRPLLSMLWVVVRGHTPNVRCTGQRQLDMLGDKRGMGEAKTHFCCYACLGEHALSSLQ